MLLIIKKPNPLSSTYFLLSPIHLYPRILTSSFCFKCVSHKAIILQGLFIRICFTEFNFTFDLLHSWTPLN